MGAMRRVRMGIIGVGSFGALHLKAYQAVHLVEVTMLVARTPSRVAGLSERYGIPYSLEYHEVLAREDIDAVDICVPAQMQAQIALDALNAGKHVLVEKPMATSITDAMQMVRTAASRERTLMVGHIERFNPSLRRAKALVAEGRIGSPVKISARRNSRREKAAWAWETVGILWHFAGHDIDLMRWLMDDEIVSVYAESASLVRGIAGQDDAICLVAHFSKGGLGVLDASWCLVENFPVEENDTRIDVLGTQGSLFIDNLDQTLGLCEQDSGWHFPGLLRWPSSQAGDAGVASYALKDELEHFAWAVLGQREAILSGCEALRVLQVIDAASQSIQRRCPVEVSYSEAGICD